MLLISLTPLFILIAIVFFITIAVLSSKGKLSPILTLLLFILVGGAAFLSSFILSSKTEPQIITEPIALTEDTPQADSVHQNEDPQSITQNPITKVSQSKNQRSESKDKNNETVEIEKPPVIEGLIPQEHPVVHPKFRTYQIKGGFELGLPFIKYFEEKTGWRKGKKGNYEIEVSQKGKFTQMDGEHARMYIYSGGAIEIKVNGNLCCCNTIFSIPGGLSDSKLVKAKEKLGQTISDLMFKNKEDVVIELQKCL
jgi:hypothetical protein